MKPESNTNKKINQIHITISQINSRKEKNHIWREDHDENDGRCVKPYKTKVKINRAL